MQNLDKDTLLSEIKEELLNNDNNDEEAFNKIVTKMFRNEDKSLDIKRVNRLGVEYFEIIKSINNFTSLYNIIDQYNFRLENKTIHILMT